MAIGSAGDLFPMLKVALALRERGHRISFLGPEQHRPYVEPAGLRFYGVAVDEAVLDDPRLWDARHGFGVVWRATRGAAAALLDFVDALPTGEACVLLVHPLALPEADLCRAARPDIRIAAVYLAPSNLPTVHDPADARPRAGAALGAAARAPLAVATDRPPADRSGGAARRESRRRLRGLPPVRGALPTCSRCPTCRWPCSRHGSRRPSRTGRKPLLRRRFPPVRPGPGNAVFGRAGGLSGGRRSAVVFTPGTGNRQAARIFRAALTAVARLGRRAIFLTPHAISCRPTCRPSVLWQRLCAAARLAAATCAALVHHGGIGTTAEASAQRHSPARGTLRA